MILNFRCSVYGTLVEICEIDRWFRFFLEPIKLPTLTCDLQMITFKDHLIKDRIAL